MATDAAKTPAVRLSEIRREWGLALDESSAQAQNKALGPLATWLKRGEESPEIVIRAVQTLLADPESSGVDRRPAVTEAIRQISETWTTAGTGSTGMLGLQALLLAAWPDGQHLVGRKVAPLLDAPWLTSKGRQRQREQLQLWRLTVQTANVHSPPDAQELNLGPTEAADSNSSITLPEAKQNQTRRHGGMLLEDTGANYSEVLAAHKEAILQLDSKSRSLTTKLEHVESTMSNWVDEAVGQLRSMQEFLWWGQSRYSQGARSPYRRIQDDTTRLWWMAWEASEVALDLDVEPAASFLVEVLHQLGENVDEERSLMTWISDLVRSLRTLHENDQHADAIALGEELKQIASKDALGMPVTWARLEAISTRNQASTLEERARRDIALDLDTLINRGDWAVWLFREALLDRHIREA